MPIKKFLKIIGLIALAFLVILFGYLLVINLLGISTNVTSNNKAVFSAMNLSMDGAQSSGLIKISSPEIAMDQISESSGGRAVSYAPSAAAVDKKIVKTGNLSLKVEKAAMAAESITNIAKLNKGEVSNSSFSESSRGTKSGYITVRVPYQNFDAVFTEIKKVAAQVMSESSNAQDITAEYIDLEARLKNTQAEEASFVALLNRSGKIEEILSVTREVARVRGEIEQLQGQMRYLSSQTDMSTITVSLSEDVEIASAGQAWRPWQVVKLSVKQLITAGQNFVDGLIRFVLVVLPIILIYALIIWLVYYIGKKIYYRFKKPEQQ